MHGATWGRGTPMSDNGGCLYAVLKAVVALLAAVDRCDSSLGEVEELKGLLLELREDLEFHLDTDTE